MECLGFLIVTASRRFYFSAVATSHRYCIPPLPFRYITVSTSCMATSSSCAANGVAAADNVLFILGWILIRVVPLLQSFGWPLNASPKVDRGCHVVQGFQGLIIPVPNMRLLG